MKSIVKNPLLAFVALALTLAFTSPAFAEKQKPPAGGPPKPFTVPAHTDFSLPNGLKVTLIPYGDVPKVTVDVIVRAGNLNEAADQVWLADITSELMKEGTQSRSAEQVAQQAAGMGGAINITVGPDQTQIESEALSEFGPKMADLLADLTQHPLLPESELPRLKKDAERRLAMALSRPGNIARMHFLKLVYPDHPYGRAYPTEAMLQKYTIQDARGFYEKNFGAERTHVYVSGKFEMAAMREAISSAFSHWERGPEPLIDVPKPARGPAFSLTDKPGAAQSTVLLGLPVLDPSQPDYIPFLVMDSLLGGSFGSRITANIRENKGYTYSPFSQVSARYRDAYWVEQADVTTNVTGPSLKEIFYEIDRLEKEPPTEPELKGIQEYMSGIFVLRNSSRQGIINQLNMVELHGLGDQWLKDYVQRVNAVTPEEVSAVARKYLVPGQMKIVVVGDKKVIADQVKPYEAVAAKE